MRKCVLLSLAIAAFVVSGCRKKQTLEEDTEDSLCGTIRDEIWNQTGVWGERIGEGFMSNVWDIDLDGDGIKEILPFNGEGGGWWLLYNKDGTWHEVSDTPFMDASYWEVYFRHKDDLRLPRFFYKKMGTDLVSAVIFDKEKGTVTLEPFDYQAFEKLRKSGALIYEDVGQDG